MQLSILAANAGANAVCTLLNNGYINVYTAPRPASTEVAVTTQTLLAQPRFGTTAFAPASGGTATANAIAEDPNTPNGGTALWFRLLKADGTTVIADGSVGVGDLDLTTDDGFDMEVAGTTVVAGRRFGIVGMNYIFPRNP